LEEPSLDDFWTSSTAWGPLVITRHARQAWPQRHLIMAGMISRISSYVKPCNTPGGVLSQS
jgi:hypothetical protein